MHGNNEPESPPPVPAFFFGLDLGQVSDYSALCLLRRDAAPRLATPRFTLANITRIPLGTSYVRIVGKVAGLVGNPELRPEVEDIGAWIPGNSVPVYKAPPPTLVIDGTGVGRPVVDMFVSAKPKLSARMTPVNITGGNAWSEVAWDAKGTRGYHVSKTELVSTLQACLQSGRLDVPSNLTYSDLLKSELQNFRVKVSRSANELFEAREGEHDDLVLAVALALWVGSRPVHRSRWADDPFAPPAPTRDAYDPCRR